MLTYPWKCTVLHCNHLGDTWKPLVLMTGHFDYCPSISEGDNQSVRSSAPVVSRCFPGGYNVKLYISRGRLAWWLLAFLHSVIRQIWSLDDIRIIYCTVMHGISSFEVPDWQVVRTSVLVTWNVGSWSWDHGFETQSNQNVMIWRSWVRTPVRSNWGCSIFVWFILEPNISAFVRKTLQCS